LKRSKDSWADEGRKKKALTCPGAARLVGTSKQREGGEERGGKGD
jgi:hypothetical protein